MATRENGSASSTSESTTTSSTAQTKATLTFTGTANKKYWIFASFMVQAGSGNTMEVTFVNTTDTVTYSTFLQDARDATDYEQWNSFIQFDAGASPTSKSFLIQFRRTAGSGAVAIKEVVLQYIEAGANDLYAESAGVVTDSTNNADGVDGVTLTVTPVAGNYLLVGTCTENNGAGSNKLLRLRGDTAGVTYNETERNQSAGTNVCFYGQRRLNLAASSQTFSVEAFNGGSASSGKEFRIGLINVDDLPNEYYAESTGISSTTSTAYQDKVSLTATPVSGEAHAILGCHDLVIQSNTTSAFSQFIADAANIAAENLKEARGSAADQYWSTGISDVFTGGGVSVTWKSQFHTEVSTIVNIRNASIAVLQLSEAVAVTKTGSLDAAVQKQIELNASLNAALQQGLTRTTSLTAALQALATRSTDLTGVVRAAIEAQSVLDAALLAVGVARTTSLNAALQVADQTQIAQLDAALQKGFTRATSLDALLKALGITRTASADAALQKGLSREASLDAVVQNVRTLQASLNGVLLKSRLVSGSLDASLSVPGAVTITTQLNAALRATISAAASIDAALQRQDITRSTALQAVLQAAGQAETASIDAVVQVARTLQANLDAVILKGRIVTSGLDASLSLAGAVFVTTQLNAALQATITAAASLDGALQRQGLTLNLSLDAALAVSRQVSASLAGVIAVTAVLSSSLDAAIRKQIALSAFFDAVLNVPGGIPDARAFRTVTKSARQICVVGPDGRTIILPGGNRVH